MISALKNSKALIICGATTSGKSTLAEKIADKLCLKLINEKTTGDYYKILDNINSHVIPQALYEHCLIYKKQSTFKNLYEKNLLVILLLAPELLKENYESRLVQPTYGDFINIDPVKQQEEILKDIEELSDGFVDKDNKIIKIQVNTIGDYAKAEEFILKEFSNL